MKADVEYDIKRAIVTRGSDEDKKVPVQQVSYNGKVIDMEIFFPYGMHANLPVSSPSSSGLVSYGFLLPINGEEDVSVGLFSAPTHRPTNLEEGEVCFFHPFTQTYIYFKNSGNLEIKTGGEEGTADITIQKDLNITVSGQANVTIVGDSTVDIGGNANINITGTATVTVPTTNWTGDINLTGNINITGTSTANNHVSNGISGNSHTHGGVQSGTSNTDGPQ